MASVAPALNSKKVLVLAIEPMINMGKKEVYTESDGWTVRTVDHSPSVHFEHDVCVQKNAGRYSFRLQYHRNS